jgi:hypothetical protein
MFVNFDLLTLSESKAEFEQSQMAQEQVAIELEQARNAWCESEKPRKVSILDHAKLTRAICSVLSGLGIPLGPVLPQMTLEEVGRIPEIIKEHEPSTARKVVHWVLAMFDSHYHGLDRTALSDAGPLASPTRTVTSSRKTAPPSPTTWPTQP